MYAQAKATHFSLSNIVSSIGNILLCILGIFFLTIIMFLSYLLFFLTICFGLFHIIGEGNGTPLQYSCLENPIDGGAW